jgi:hypothetical protein
MEMGVQPLAEQKQNVILIVPEKSVVMTDAVEAAEIVEADFIVLVGFVKKEMFIMFHN